MGDIPLEFIAMKMAEAHGNGFKQGTASERASIVAWIRSHSSDGWFSVLDAANGIERGEHAQPEPPQ